MTEKGFSDEQIEEFGNEMHKAYDDGKSPFLWKKLTSGKIDPRAEVMEPWGSRVTFHLDRLINPRRSQVEQDFAQAVLKFGGPIINTVEENDYEKYHRIKGTLEGEGYDTCIWWTLSPYLFAELKGRLGDKRAMETLLDWAQDGEALGRGQNDDIDHLHLKGLDIYNYYYKGSKVFVLGQNPQGYSHAFAKKEAQRLANEVFGFKV
jgi:hypothetical protein